MNKDIEDSLRAIQVMLKGIRGELEALFTQYALSNEETDALHDLAVKIGNAISEIERMMP